MSDIGKRIREKRELIGMTQEELSQLLGYKNKSTIAKIETGTNDIVQSKVVDFAKALGTTVPYLMGWEEEKELLTPENAVLHARMQHDLEYTRLYKVWMQLNDTGKQKLIDNANDLVQIYNKQD